MPQTRKLHVVLCWHMHQPDYRGQDGRYVLPWTALHAFKDYTDMAWYLEHCPDAKAVFNFVPILVEQIDDYCRQFETGEFRDPLLAALGAPDLKVLGEAERHTLLHQCFRVDREHMLDPFPAYRRLFEIYSMIRSDEAELADYLSTQYLADLLVWYHLAWTGETVRRGNPYIQAMFAKGRAYTPEDRRGLLQVLGQIMQEVLPRYRKLAERGQIELSTTPYFHPISPLLLDFAAARESIPDAELPQCQGYPGGPERVRWHLEKALESHQTHFGSPPAGLWPAEGSLSAPFMEVLETYPVQWTASGEGVLVNSLKDGNGQVPLQRHEYLYRPYRLGNAGPYLFFRDDALADAIGFDYKGWNGHDAVNDFVHHLEEIWRHTQELQGAPVVSVILDGENAWEYYPYNAYYFLSELYRVLSHHPHIALTTFRDYLNAHKDTAVPLDRLVAGSWVYGTLSTWIGAPAKNAAWDLLCAAKEATDKALPFKKPAEREAIRRQLGICEGSDWFWWFGDYNPGDSVRDFDKLYRANLARLYDLLGQPAPEELSRPLSAGGGQPEAGGTMRRGTG